DHQWTGEHRVAPLPSKLHHHLDAEEPSEVNVVPRRLPVVERFDVLDGDVRLRLVANDARNHLVLGLDLRSLVDGVVKHLAVTITEDVVSDPTQNPPIPEAEHGAKDGLEKRLAGLAVFAARNRHTMRGELLTRRGAR